MLLQMFRVYGVVLILLLLLLKKLVVSTASEGKDLENIWSFDNGLQKGCDWPIYKLAKFNCSTKLPTGYKKAKTVHKLTPFDVDLVGALGDSITAGFGALSLDLIHMFTEYRGISWSAGGDSDLDIYVTLPNILTKYKPNLQGFSTGTVPLLIPLTNIHLNKAVSGAVSYDLLGQAQKYVEDLVLNPKYDFFGSWKILTIFIGINDLCSCCRPKHRVKYSPAKYVKEVQKALDYLHERVPKLFVNLVTSPDVTLLKEMNSGKCAITHIIECKCGSGYDEEALNLTKITNEQYHVMYDKLVNSGRYDTRDDFTVVIQPLFNNVDIPKLPDGSADTSYFAPDCFHFSGKAHAAAARGLWNIMLKPVGKKSGRLNCDNSFQCPDPKFPYFYTNKNSENWQ